MIKYCLDRWNKNQQVLREELEKDPSLNSCNYAYLVKLITKHILGDGWDAEGITVVDNGDYQGTLLFLIPQNTYQPAEHEYLMTYVGYGSCSCCDALQRIQDYSDHPVTSEQINDFMILCKDLITNMIKPYNTGWRATQEFEPVSVEE